DPGTGDPENEEAGEDVAAKSRPPNARRADQERKEFIGRHEHEVVEPGLIAAILLLLREPVVERTPGAGTKATEVRPNRCHEREVEKGRAARGKCPRPGPPL